MHINMEDWERLVSIVAGAAFFETGRRRRGVTRAAAWMTGASLIAQGASGYSPVNATIGRERLRDNPRRALSGAHGFIVTGSVTIETSPGTLFDIWRDPSRLPWLMPGLVAVERLDDRRSHWVARGPAGHTVEWDARIINEIPGELIAWETLPGADVASAGSVRFRPLARGGTQVDVRLQYAPPLGRLGASAAWIFGRSAATQVREALRHLKQVVETGETPTVEGQPSGTRRATFAAVTSIA